MSSMFLVKKSCRPQSEDSDYYEKGFSFFFFFFLILFAEIFLKIKTFQQYISATLSRKPKF